MKRRELNYVPTTFLSKDKEEGKYTTLFTDVGNFEILMTLEDLQKEIKRVKSKIFGDKLFKYRKLEEYSQTLQHYGELVLDLSKVKILGFKEHHLIDDFKKAKEIEDLETKNK